jgi:N-acetylglucosaminyl-diphospho-decaprenol L-rhamnosyltransferase
VQRHALADSRLRFIANPDNPGFGTACNQGAFDTASMWLAFVNPDCWVEIDTLARLRAHAQGYTDARGSDVLLGADLVDEAGVRDGAARRRDPVFSAMLFSSAARRLDIAPNDRVAFQPVPAISGALMLVRRTLFERIRGFDQAYRLHAEDLDLCRRIRDAGGAVAVANDARVVHVRGVSSRARPFFVEWQKHRGLWRYYCTFEAPHQAWPVRAAVWTMISARCAFTLLKTFVRSAFRNL